MVISSLVNFTIVVFILWWFGRKPVADLFRQRHETIKTAISQAEREYQEAEKALSTWQEKLRGAEAEEKALQKDAEIASTRFRERALAAAKAEAERIKAESQLLGKGEILRARRILQREMAEKSIALAENYLTKKLDDRDKHQLVSEYVEIVGNG